MIRGLYAQGDTAILYANFLELSGGEPTTLVNPRVTVKHLESGVETIDVNNQSLTHITGNEYYYEWDISASAYITDYFVVYSATIDGEYAEATEVIKIISAQEAVLGGIGSHYTTKDAVLDLMGPNYVEADIKDSFLTFADSYIDALVKTQFRSITVTEKYDVETETQDTIFLKNYPIVSIDYVKDGVNTIDSNDYAIYNEEGYIRLHWQHDWRLVDEPYFTRGLQQVEIKYTYGYATVPGLISFLATLLVAELVDMSKSSAVGGKELKSEDIGAYSYTYFESGKTRRAATISELKDRVLWTYGNNPRTRAV